MREKEKDFKLSSDLQETLKELDEMEKDSEKFKIYYNVDEMLEDLTKENTEDGAN